MAALSLKAAYYIRSQQKVSYFPSSRQDIANPSLPQDHILYIKTDTWLTDLIGSSKVSISQGLVRNISEPGLDQKSYAQGQWGELNSAVMHH